MTNSVGPILRKWQVYSYPFLSAIDFWDKSCGWFPGLQYQQLKNHHEFGWSESNAVVVVVR